MAKLTKTGFLSALAEAREFVGYVDQRA